MSRSRRAAGAVRGPASALTSFLAGLGVEPSARLTTWGDNSLITSTSTDDGQTALAHDGPVVNERDLDPAGAVTARTVEAGPSVAGEGTPEGDSGNKREASNINSPPPTKRRRAVSVNSDDLDHEPAETSAASEAPEARSKVVAGPLKAAGEFMTCGECTKRFTVTAYTKEHPQNSNTWLCLECCFALGIDPYAKAKKPPRKKAGGKEDRGKVVHYEQRKGVMTLSDICIELIGKHIEHVEELGDIGGINLDKVCKIISKSRKLTPATASLFYSGDRTELSMYDCTNLVHESYVTMSKLCPELETLHLHLCGQLHTDSVIAWGENLKHLRRLEVFAPFLVRKEGWMSFFKAAGQRLEGFLVTQSPRIDEETVEALVASCPDLSELRLAEVEKLNDDWLRSLGILTLLTKLDLSSPGTSLSDEGVGALLGQVGSNLTALNLSDNPDLTDSTLLTVSKHCPQLRELHMKHLVELTDDGVAGFFRVLRENEHPGLEIIDLEKGHALGSKALSSMIAHSGMTMRRLSVLGWREVEAEALSRLATCEHLQYLDLGWCRKVTDFVLRDIVEGCGEMREIKVWGCNQLTDAVPRKRGVKVVGIETHSI